MKLAVLTRQQDPFSLSLYRENVVRELVMLGVKVIPFMEAGPIPPQCDLIWDPGLGMRSIPNVLKRSAVPIVCTVHGLRAFSLPCNELTSSWKDQLLLFVSKTKVSYDWSWFRKKVSAVIAVSEYGTQEINRAVGLSLSKIRAIYHGVDHNTFHAEGASPSTERPFLLMVAQYQPKKNVDRIFTAYEQLSGQDCPDLVAILPGYRDKVVHIKGMKLICEGIAASDLAKWYRSALGFVFPSLHETFGMPILEAMACGCPVITSNNTGCAEIAGDAALLVDPRSVKEIATAMQRLITDRELRKSLREKGIKRASMFTWEKCAQEHLKVFEGVFRKG